MADYYIDLLRRPFSAYWAMRYGADLKTPTASIQGPKVMIIDETAGSGGDLLPWMWRKFKMGPLVGKRTWGGLVGMLGFPVLMDGGSVTAPNLAIWMPEDGWVVENEGVPPDIEVEQTPGRRDRRARPAAREGDPGRDGGAEEEPAGQADAAGVSESEGTGSRGQVTGYRLQVTGYRGQAERLAGGRVAAICCRCRPPSKRESTARRA